MAKHILCLLIILLSACASPKPSRYQIESRNPTPKSFLVGSKWGFALLDSHGEIFKTVVFEITDIDVKTCESGITKKLKVISESPVGVYPKLFNPTYKVTGAAIRISFSPELCDANYALIGSISELGAIGFHTPEELIFGRHNKNVGGSFYGFPVGNKSFLQSGQTFED